MASGMEVVRASVPFALVPILALTLMGCGGGRACEPNCDVAAPPPTTTTTTSPAPTTTTDPTTTTSPTTTTVETTITTSTTKTTWTTTRTYHWDVGPCDVENDVQKCVDFLNEQYMGYDENDDSSPIGVTIRGQPKDQKWMFCGDSCFRGQADCYVAASVLNHKVMLCQEQSTNTPKCRGQGAPAIPMNYPVGIIFQPNAVATQITKCSWDFDGAAFNNINGGCGSLPPQQGSCDAKDAAYNGICPDTGKPIVDDYTCPTVERKDCTLTSQSNKSYPNACYHIGAAFYSDTRPGYDRFPPNMMAGTDAGLRAMLKQRMQYQGSGSEKTPSGISLVQFWNEVTMDGKVLQGMLKWQPKAAIAAFVYMKDNVYGKNFADGMNNLLMKDWGVKVPVVAMDVKTAVAGTAGPFAVPPVGEEIV